MTATTGWRGCWGTLGRAILSIGPAGAGPSVYPTGVTVYDPAKAYSSFVLFNGP